MATAIRFQCLSPGREWRVSRPGNPRNVKLGTIHTTPNGRRWILFWEGDYVARGSFRRMKALAAVCDASGPVQARAQRLQAEG